MRFEKLPNGGKYLQIIYRKAREGGDDHVHSRIFRESAIHKK
jgi:hypothetical protein